VKPLRRPAPRFDHADLVDREPLSWARFTSTLLRAHRGGGAQDIDMIHDDDRACCGREPWSETLTAAIDELRRAAPEGDET
jgi:hypothetical protein